MPKMIFRIKKMVNKMEFDYFVCEKVCIYRFRGF